MHVQAHEVADRLGLVGPTVEQPEYSLFQRCRIEEEYQPLFEDYGMGVTSYSPLACGLLTGKYSKGDAKVEGTRFSLERYKVRCESWFS